MKITKFFIILLAFSIFSCSEDIKDYYQICSKQDLIENPWLPNFIEKIDCKDIYLYHNLDTNELWGKLSIVIIPDSVFELENSNFIIGSKMEKRLKKIGLKPNFLILKAEDETFDINLFYDSDNQKMFFYGKMKII